MQLHKTGVVLLALLLAAMAMVPMVNAATHSQLSGADRDIVSLFAPVNTEIHSALTSIGKDGKTDKSVQNSTKFSERLVEKYQNNLDLIIDSLEKQTGQKLAADEREDLKKIIVLEHMKKVSYEQLKEKMGVKEEDLIPVFISPETTRDPTNGAQLAYMPNSLTLVQVSADVYGGVGFDGGWRPYIVNGGNQLYGVYWNSGPGWALYQWRFYDEDVPSSYAADLAYDLFRLRVYGTVEDIQGFFIYNNNSIEFGNDWDNGCSYGTVVGQHGSNTLPYGPSTVVYVSNVWNHAMGITDRNPNMGKITYNY
ncbi:MAG: hypothetical protein WC586_10880 [Methanoregula sp.]